MRRQRDRSARDRAQPAKERRALRGRRLAVGDEALALLGRGREARAEELRRAPSRSSRAPSSASSRFARRVIRFVANSTCARRAHVPRRSSLATLCAHTPQPTTQICLSRCALREPCRCRGPTRAPSRTLPGGRRVGAAAHADVYGGGAIRQHRRTPATNVNEGRGTPTSSRGLREQTERDLAESCPPAARGERRPAAGGAERGGRAARARGDAARGARAGGAGARRRRRS